MRHKVTPLVILSLLAAPLPLLTRILAGPDASLPPDVPCIDSDKPYLDDSSRTAPL